MTDLKTILLCTRVNFFKWLVTPRIHTIAAVIIAFGLWSSSGLSEYADAVGAAVTPWVFPHLLTSPAMLLVFGCLTTLLFCNAPFADDHTPFLVIRSGRLNWVVGQLLYIVLAGFIYTAFWYVASVVTLIPNLQLSTDWGKVIKTLAANPMSARNYGIQLTVFFNPEIIAMFSAVEATLIGFGLFWLVSVFIGVLIFCFNIVIGKMSGLVASGVFIFMSYFSIYVGTLNFGPKIYYFSPYSWASMNYLNWKYTGEIPSPTYAVFCLLGAILFMSIVSVIVFCKKDMNIQEWGA